MNGRQRIVAFGSAAALALAGGVCAVLVDGVVGEIATVVLLSVGLGGGLLLVFLEIGFGEERDVAREQARRRQRAQWAIEVRRRPRLRGRRRRPR